jgi:hypothetical protein
MLADVSFRDSEDDIEIYIRHEEYFVQAVDNV